MAETSSARGVAAEIRRRCPGVHKTKVHKLLYYVQGYHLAWEGPPAFRDQIEAWEQGPVVASLWHTENLGITAWSEALPQSVRNIITNVLCRLGHKSDCELIEAAHREDPWVHATEGGTHIANQVISHKSLTKFFSIESPDIQRLREALDLVRDDSPFVPDPPGALDALVARYQRR